MRFTIFRNQKNSNRVSMQVVVCNALVNSMVGDTTDKIVATYHGVFLTLDKPGN